MSDVMQAIRTSATWTEYYEAYKRAYQTILESKWALGKTTFAHQLHHTAIPDASGTTAGVLNWAVYSQPSSETMKAFIDVFADALRAEPHRVHSNRYLLFVTSGTPLATKAVREMLGDVGSRIDVWSGSLEMSVADSDVQATITGIYALMLDAEPPRLPEPRSKEAVELALHQVRATEQSGGGQSMSVVPRRLRTPLLNSSVVLLCARTNIGPDEAAALIGDGAGVAAIIAAERARAASWDDDAVQYCESVMKSSKETVIEYVVRPGDILTRIVRRELEMSFDAIWPLIHVLNPELSNPNLIYPGHVIRLPSFS